MTIESVLDAMREWAQADAELRAAVKDCAEDADYFCADEYRREKRKREDVGRALTLFVADVVEKQLRDILRSQA